MDGAGSLDETELKLWRDAYLAALAGLCANANRNYAAEALPDVAADIAKHMLPPTLRNTLCASTASG